METKHTPGPWQVSGVRVSQPPRIGRDARILNIGPDGDYLAMVFFDMKTGRGQADARLIAAAPDLLAALEHILEGALSLPRFAEVEARAAIAKATGVNL